NHRQANGTILKTVVILNPLSVGKFTHRFLNAGSRHLTVTLYFLTQLKLHSTDLSHMASKHGKHVDFIVKPLKYPHLELTPVLQNELLVAVEHRAFCPWRVLTSPFHAMNGGRTVLKVVA